jgi:uncharacterized protein YecE (DUF72 family)
LTGRDVAARRPNVTRPRIGTAGWTIPKPYADSFPAEGSHLQRYAQRFNAVEINSSFYRPHRRATYERWAASTPADFAFAVKVPKTITHERRLIDATALLDPFLEQASGLGGKLAVLLVQLPPSLAFDEKTASGFLAALRSRHAGYVALEPRHATWFTPQGDALLRDHRVARVAADPAVVPAAPKPGGWTGLRYLRLHGAPHIYRSDYEPEQIARFARTLMDAAPRDPWCIFDNTTLGAATANALAMSRMLGGEP